MFHFKIIPTDPSVAPKDVHGYDAAGLLLAIQQLSIKEARVMRDGEHWITVRLDQSGVWHVLRDGKPAVPVNEILLGMTITGSGII